MTSERLASDYRQKDRNLLKNTNCTYSNFVYDPCYSSVFNAAKMLNVYYLCDSLDGFDIILRRFHCAIKSVEIPADTQPGYAWRPSLLWWWETTNNTFSDFPRRIYQLSSADPHYFKEFYIDLRTYFNPAFKEFHTDCCAHSNPCLPSVWPKVREGECDKKTRAWL